MNFSCKSVPSFVLLIAGSMGFGSLYSALLNTVGREIIPVFFVLMLLPMLLMFAGFYSYNYIAYGKGKKWVAFVLVLLAALAATGSMAGGKADSQVWFALHEVLNVLAAWGATVVMALSFKK